MIIGPGPAEVQSMFKANQINAAWLGFKTNIKENALDEIQK